MRNTVEERMISTRLTEELMDFADASEEQLNAAVEWLELNYPVVAWWNPTDRENRYVLKAIVKHSAELNHAKRSLRAAESKLMDGEFNND